jgi:hypothetical protein
VNRSSLDLDGYKDGDAVLVRHVVASPELLTVRITNRATCDIALYACSRRATTSYPVTRCSYSYGVMV